MEIHDVLGILSVYGCEAYLVGGCVRDLVDGRLPKDYDIATSARVDEVAGLFLRTIPTGLKHGTVTVLSGTYAVEVTTFRSEGSYHDHRRPSEVVFHGDLALDLSRRDFTCNAMAWSQNRGLVDLFGGCRDMEARILRTVGDPAARFLEDALRMLRAIRFCCTFGYRPVEPLIEACTRHSGLLSHVSAERIASECARIFLSPFPEWLRAFDGTGILEAAFARLLPIRIDSQGLAFGDAIASALTRFGPSVEGGYALLLLLEPKWTKTDSKPMQTSESYTEEKRRLMEGHRLAARVAGKAAAMAWVVVEIRGFLLRTDSGSAADLRRIAAALVRTADLKGEEARKMMVEGARLLVSIEPETEDSIYSFVDAIFRDGPPVAVDELALTGADLVARGQAPGPSLGRLRLRLLDAVLEDPSRNVPNALWALVRGMI
jgi:tRNA nucleotidyltransferase (CCA-adding enzyme)